MHAQSDQSISCRMVLKIVLNIITGFSLDSIEIVLLILTLKDERSSAFVGLRQSFTFTSPEDRGVLFLNRIYTTNSNALFHYTHLK